jgi:hypothetical protein
MAEPKRIACDGDFDVRAYAGEIEKRGEISAQICAKERLKCAKNTDRIGFYVTKIYCAKLVLSDGLFIEIVVPKWLYRIQCAKE